MECGWLATVLAAVPLAGMLGCRVGPNFVPPRAPAANAYTHRDTPSGTVRADGQAQQFEPGAPVAADWWKLFRSPPMDARIDAAVSNNPTLQAAQSSLRASEDALRAGYGVFFPQVDATAGATRERYGLAGVSTTRQTFSLYTLSGTVAYTLDVFGGERRAIESEQAQVDAQRYLTAAAYLTLVGNVVNATIAEAGYVAEVDATRRLIAEERDQAQLAAAQARAGTVPYAGVLALEAQLAATEATLPVLKQKLAQTEHLLATLLGQEPAHWASPRVELSTLNVPGEIPLTLPSELVHQRPDILAAEAALHRASAEIGVATAALFPSFTLSGSYGWNATSLTDLVAPESRLWSLGAGLAAPLFHGGALWFQRRAAIDNYQQSLGTYRQTVLSGLAQVADALRGLQHDAQQVAAESRQYQAAQEGLRLTQVNYRAGLVDYLQVLTANGQYEQATLGYLGGRTQRLQDTVALFVALGGGWWDAKDAALRG
jgi:NodT family efflux transporter outer membrane factor (OMF) lipoprotein